MEASEATEAVLEEMLRRVDEIRRSLREISQEAGAMVSELERGIRESDRRAEERQRIYRRAGIVLPPVRGARF